MTNVEKRSFCSRLSLAWRALCGKEAQGEQAGSVSEDMANLRGQFEGLKQDLLERFAPSISRAPAKERAAWVWLSSSDLSWFVQRSSTNFRMVS